MTASPYARMLGVEAGADGVLVLPFAEVVVGRPGFLHGGAIAGLLELAARAALEAALADAAVRADVAAVTTTIEFLRGGRDATTYAAGDVTRLGSRIANVSVIAWQGDAARPIATARITFVIDRNRQD